MLDQLVDLFVVTSPARCDRGEIVRRLLFSLGCFVAGLAVAALGAMTVFGGLPFATGAILIALYLLFGMGLSAPYMLFPPRDGPRASFWLLPLKWWLILQPLRGINWVGRNVLEFLWRLVFRLRSPSRGRHAT